MSDDKPSNKLFRNLAIFLGIAFLLAMIFPMIYVRYTPTDFASLKSADWKTVRLGYPLLEIETPVPLENESRKPSEEEREFFEYQQRFVYEDGRDFKLIATTVNYNRHVYIDPNAVEQSVQGYAQQFGAQDIRFTSSDVVLNELPGKRIDGTFTIGSRKLAFTRISLEYKYVVRDLLVVYRDQDADGLAVRDRIVKSLKLDNNY